MNSLKTAAFAVVFMALVAAGGCASSKPLTARPVSGATREVIEELQRSVAGWNSTNLDAFMEVYAVDATFAGEQRYVRGQAAIRAGYAHDFAPGAEHLSLKMEPLEVEELAPGLVLVRGIYQTSRAGVESRRGTTSLVMRRLAGRWRIIHDHSS